MERFSKLLGALADGKLPIWKQSFWTAGMMTAKMTIDEEVKPPKVHTHPTSGSGTSRWEMKERRCSTGASLLPVNDGSGGGVSEGQSS